MNLHCDVIKDLLPLYVEGMVSAQTRTLVQEHLAICESCNKEWEEMREPAALPPDVNILPLQQIKAALRRKKMLTILLSVILTLIALSIVAGYALSPQFIPYSKGLIRIAQNDHGVITATFEGAVAGYAIDSFYSPEHDEGRVYSISAWNTAWSTALGGRKYTDVVISPGGEAPACIYYASNDGTLDTLLYGVNRFGSGGSMALPRLVLAYYAMLAAAMALILGLAFFLLRKRKRITRILSGPACFFASYVLASLLIKKGHMTSYALMHDLCAILLLTILLFSLTCVIRRLLKKT